MYAQRSIRIALAATLAVSGTMITAGARADSAQPATQTKPVIVYPHQGAGVGSVKTPPFQDTAYNDYLRTQNPQKHAAYFHTSSGRPVTWTGQRQGPGPWSPKAPGVH